MPTMLPTVTEAIQSNMEVERNVKVMVIDVHKLYNKL